MLFMKNVPGWERTLRVLGGLVILGLGFYFFPHSWLVAVVRRQCLRIGAMFTGRGGADADLALAYESDEAARLDVSAAIESLPPHYREVVILRDFEEMTVDEIGAQLGLTREAVKGRLHRARGLLREYLSR